MAGGGGKKDKPPPKWHEHKEMRFAVKALVIMAMVFVFMQTLAEMGVDTRGMLNKYAGFGNSNNAPQGPAPPECHGVKKSTWTYCPRGHKMVQCYCP